MSEAVRVADGSMGRGLYSVPFAARLTGVGSDKIRRWLFGSARTKALLIPAFEEDEGDRVLSFLDLIEIMLVGAFRDAGVSFQHLRRVADKSARELHTDHPFAHKRFLTDGRKIFVEELDGDDLKLSDFLKDQREFREFIDRTLHKGVEFDVRDVAKLWRPDPSLPDIVLDPTRSFGQPIVDRTRTPTGAIYRVFRGTGSLGEAAATFDVRPQEARQAVEFEQRLELASAA